MIGDTPRLKIPKAFRELNSVKARYKGFYGGRGGAKSHSFATTLVLKGSESEVGKRILCCREIQRSIRESVKQTLEAKIVAGGLQDFYVATNTEIRGANGTQFLFEGLRSNVTAIQSLEGIDIVWIEEANTVSRSSLDVLIPTIRSPGSELWFSWNPRNPTDPVDAMFRGPGAEELAGETIPKPYDQWMVSREVGFQDNPYFPDVLHAEMERDKRRDPDKYAHIWLGKYASRSESRVFKNWRIDTIEIPSNAKPYYGADWGFAIDPTVLVRCFIFPKDRVLYVDAEVAGVGVEIDKTPAFFDKIASDPEDPLHPRRWPVKADSARPETISYMQRHGYPHIQPARKGPGSVDEGIEFLKSYDIVVHPNCRRVIDELTLYSYEIDKLTNEVLPVLADDDNHTIDALRYAAESVRRSSEQAIVSPVVIPGMTGAFGDYPQ